MRPEDILSDNENGATVGGIYIRKGTIAAFLANAKTLDDAHTSEPDRVQAEQLVREAFPALDQFGFFDLFEPRGVRLRALVIERR